MLIIYSKISFFVFGKIITFLFLTIKLFINTIDNIKLFFLTFYTASSDSPKRPFSSLFNPLLAIENIFILFNSSVALFYNNIYDYKFPSVYYSI